MLLRLKIQNFLSFFEESTFDMFPNIKKKIFPHHIYINHEIPLLKQAVIYGANGSGKSNLLKALGFIKQFATEKDFLKKRILEENKFRLVIDNINNPIQFSIEFKNNNEYYIYNIELNIKNIKEELSTFNKDGNKTLIYKRNGDKFTSNDEVAAEVQIAINKLIKTNPLASLLSLNNEFPIISNPKVGIAFNWFDKKLEILSLKRFHSSLIDQMSKNKNLLIFANKIFAKLDLGIESLYIRTDNLNDVFNTTEDKDIKIKEFFNNQLKNKDLYSYNQDDKLIFSIVKEKEEQFVKEFIFKQLGVGDFKGEMDIRSQSDGTVKLLNLLPALYDVIEKGKIICIDEIENSIHPSLISSLIKYFSNSDSKGQLIFTTHETELLNQQKLMRPDEVWFTEKHNGDTKLYSLNDFKEHNTINIRNGYLEGRYGGIPFIGSLEK